MRNSNFGIGVLHVKSNIDVFFGDIISLLAQVFIVSSNRVSKEVSMKKFYGSVFVIWLYLQKTTSLQLFMWRALPGCHICLTNNIDDTWIIVSIDLPSIFNTLGLMTTPICVLAFVFPFHHVCHCLPMTTTLGNNVCTPTTALNSAVFKPLT